MPVRYPSLASRRQVTAARDRELRQAVAQAASHGFEPVRPIDPSEVVYAENLRPTVPGYVRGVVSLDPPEIQCDGCAFVYRGATLALAALLSGILFDTARRDPRRLCETCRSTSQVA